MYIVSKDSEIQKFESGLEVISVLVYFDGKI